MFLENVKTTTKELETSKNDKPQKVKFVYTFYGLDY